MNSMWSMDPHGSLSCVQQGLSTPASFREEMTRLAIEELNGNNITARGGHFPKLDYTAPAADGACLYAQVLSALLGVHPEGFRHDHVPYTLSQLQNRDDGVYEAITI